MERGCGVLLHISSLASNQGIGSLDGAVEFLDFLNSAGIRYWQVLPLNIPDDANSPYSSMSAFAFYPLLIGIKLMVSSGYLAPDEVNDASINEFNPRFAKEFKEPLFRLAFKRFVGSADYKAFVARNMYWLKDYATYAVIKEVFGGSWRDWKSQFKTGDKKALTEFSKSYNDEIRYHFFLQYVFYSQWRGIRREASIRKIKIIGDLPFYVSYDSSDVWAAPSNYKLNDDLSVKKVAGVPPDYFSPDGQLWGNPIYNWEHMRSKGYKWWLSRIRHAKNLFDCLRIDHFRAFDAYWEVDAHRNTARKGKWVKGERELVKTLIAEAGRMEIFAENLGFQSKSLNELMNENALAGMKVMQFAFDGNWNNEFLPHNYPDNCLAYIGTHDNATALEWWSGLNKEERDRVYSYAGLETDYDICRKLIKLLCRSNAGITVFSMQDIINSRKRMNTPGTTKGNWEFMLKFGELKSDDAKYLLEINRMYGRIKS